MSKWNSRKIFALVAGLLSPILIAFGVPEDLLNQLIEKGEAWVILGGQIVAIVYIMWQGGIDKAAVTKKPE